MSTELLWYLSRATGVVSTVLLTAVVVLGTLTASRRVPGGEKSAVVLGLHRTLALGSVAFLVLHIVTAILDSYVDIGWLAVVVPFTSGYETAWVSLGTLAFDIGAAVLVTSLLRHRLPVGAWRAVHLTAYAFWPLAIVHGLAMSSSDVPLLQWITIACTAIGGGAIACRLIATDKDTDRRREVALQEWS